MRARIGIVCLCAVGALLQVHLVEMASGNLMINMGEGAVQGWSGYHSRLLGIGLIRFFGGDLNAVLEVTTGGLVIAGLLAWRLGGAGGLGIFHGCFAVWANPWFSPWDIFEPAIFIAFVVLVVEEFAWYWFVGLFAVAIFNLQSAMFIALWMVLKGVLE